MPSSPLAIAYAAALILASTKQHVFVVGLPPTFFQQPEGATVAEANLADDFESLQAKSAREREARAEAETREAAAVSAAVDLDAQAVRKQSNHDQRQAKSDAEVVARNQIGNTIAAKTLQAAESVHIKIDSQAAHSIASKRATSIANTVTGEQRKVADKELAVHVQDFKKTVTVGNEDVTRHALQAASTNVTFVNAREKALADDHVARTDYLYASVATDSVSASRKQLEALEIQARASEERAASLEAASTEDHRKLREAELAYEAAIHEEELQAAQRVQLQEELNQRLGNLTVGVVSQALDNVAPAHAHVRDAKLQAEVDAQGRVSTPAPSWPPAAVAVAISPENDKHAVATP